ncbi:hypothetical protein HK096_005624, partial [Nowakowskiella sp. JEL0078]
MRSFGERDPQACGGVEGVDGGAAEGTCRCLALGTDGRSPLHVLWAKGNRVAFYDLLAHARSNGSLRLLALALSALHLAVIDQSLSGVKSFLSSCKISTSLFVPLEPSHYSPSESDDDTLTDIPPLVEPNETPWFLHRRSHTPPAVRQLPQPPHLVPPISPVNAVDALFATPLHHAVALNNLQIVDALLNAGADINAKDEPGRTPLFIAACDDRLEIVERLISCGAALDLANVDGVTALGSAVFQHHFEVAAALVLAGADVDTTWKCGCTTLIHLATEGRLEAVNFLLSNGANVNFKEPKRLMSALHYAASKGYLEVVKLLIQNCADPEANTLDGITPLHLAASSNHVDVVQYLGTIGVQIERFSVSNRYTALHSASRKGGVESTRALLVLGANVDSQTHLLDFNCEEMSWSPLHVACRHGHIEVAKVLIQNGANVNQYGQEVKSTPLHISAKRADFEMVRLLLDNGANCSLMNNQKKLPIQRLLEGKFPPEYENRASKTLELLFWSGRNEELCRSQMTAFWRLAAEKGYKEFCLRALIDNDGIFTPSSIPLRSEVPIMHYYNLMMFRWILTTRNNLTKNLLPELYREIE